MAGNCKTCGAPITRQSRTGYCKKHVAAAIAQRPEWREAQRAGIVRGLQANPERKDRLREQIQAVGMLPQAVEARRQRFLTERIWERGIATLAANPELRALSGKRQSNTKMAWCPRELRDEYKRLVYSQKIPAAEAKAMILEQHERDMARFRQKVLAAS